MKKKGNHDGEESIGIVCARTRNQTFTSMSLRFCEGANTRKITTLQNRKKKEANDRIVLMMKGITLVVNKRTRSQPPYKAGILRPLESLSESASSQLSQKPESGLCEAVDINIISLSPSRRVWSNRSPRTHLFGPQGENMIFSYPTYASFDGKSSSKASLSKFSELVKRLRNVTTFFFFATAIFRSIYPDT